MIGNIALIFAENKIIFNITQNNSNFTSGIKKTEMITFDPPNQQFVLPPKVYPRGYQNTWVYWIPKLKKWVGFDYCFYSEDKGISYIENFYGPYVINLPPYPENEVIESKNREWLVTKQIDRTKWTGCSICGSHKVVCHQEHHIHEQSVEWTHKCRDCGDIISKIASRYDTKCPFPGCRQELKNILTNEAKCPQCQANTMVCTLIGIKDCPDHDEYYHFNHHCTSCNYEGEVTEHSSDESGGCLNCPECGAKIRHHGPTLH